MRANTQKRTARGATYKRGRRGKEKNIGEQRHEESCGRESNGVHKVNKMDNTGTFRSLNERDFQEGKQGI